MAFGLSIPIVVVHHIVATALPSGRGGGDAAFGMGGPTGHLAFFLLPPPTIHVADAALDMEELMGGMCGAELRLYWPARGQASG